MPPLFGATKSMFETTQQFFRDDDWRFERIEGTTILRMGFRGDSGSWRCYAHVREEQKQLMFFSVLDTNCPEELRPKMADFLNRANYGLVSGNFEMDASDGQIRFRTSLDVRDNEDRFCPGLVKRIVYINVLMTDKYLPGIMGVMYGGLSPEEAIAKVEG